MEATTRAEHEATDQTFEERHPAPSRPLRSPFGRTPCRRCLPDTPARAPHREPRYLDEIEHKDLPATRDVVFHQLGLRRTGGRCLDAQRQLLADAAESYRDRSVVPVQYLDRWTAICGLIIGYTPHTIHLAKSRGCTSGL